VLRLAGKIAFALALGVGQVALAQGVAPPPAPVEPAVVGPLESEAPLLDIHGFVSQGAFISTANNYLGHSKRGSVELTEAALNASREVADRLRVGLQLFAHDVGPLGDFGLRLDWGYLDYRWRQWLGVRAGRIKLPFGLYNEVNDVPAGRLPILLPPSLYPVDQRDFLLALNGAAVYGSPIVGPAGEIDYQAFFGTIFIDPTETTSILAIDVRRVLGAQVFWRPPIEALRVGASLLNIRADFNIQFTPAEIEQLIALGAAEPGYDGKAQLRLRDANYWVGSAEYAYRQWLFAAEYSRQLTHGIAVPAMLLQDTDVDSERFYGLASYRFDDHFEAGGYYSVTHVDAGDRTGERPPFVPSHRAYHRDLAFTARYDVNEFWLLKAEGHYIQGTSQLILSDNPGELVEDWGLFVVQTVLSF
jgi:hypothetical protein